MRPSAAAVVLGLAGILVLPTAPTAMATAVCGSNPLGIAGNYTEFVEGDSLRYSDSEGAVAVGGNAHFGDGRTGQGFSIGDKLTETDLAQLPGRHSLIVGGTLTANQVALARGSAVYGTLEGQNGGQFAIDGSHNEGKSPVDFGKEFEELRSRSEAWATTKANGKVTDSKDDQLLLLTGEDAKLNVFTVNASALQNARGIVVHVPTASTTLVNVIGTSYDMTVSATYGIYLWDPEKQDYVLDDYNAGSSTFKGIRSKMLWNFPQARSVVKNETSWPGTVLAPRAEVRMGRTAGDGVKAGPGHINGSVIARELTTVPGAETHQMRFTGCLPSPEGPEAPITSAPDPAPAETPLPPLEKPSWETYPLAPAAPSTPEPPVGSTEHSPSATSTASSTSATKPTPVSSAEQPPNGGNRPSGNLAASGSTTSISLIASGGAALLCGAALVGVAHRRRTHTNRSGH